METRYVRARYDGECVYESAVTDAMPARVRVAVRQGTGRSEEFRFCVWKDGKTDQTGVPCLRSRYVVVCSLLFKALPYALLV
jgi:hypothetical protein